MKVVVMISANTEWKAVKEIFPSLVITASTYGDTATMSIDSHELKLLHSGWGKIASAGAIQYVIDHDRPDLIVNLGTCGGFDGVTGLGDIILVERTFIYDIVELIGDPNVLEYYASILDLGWLAEPYPFPVRKGIIASADSDLPPERIAYLKSMGAIAGDWESGALAWVAKKNAARLLILRGVSDVVSEAGGEVYDNLSLYEERTKSIMQKLFNQLPGWLNCVEIPKR